MTLRLQENRKHVATGFLNGQPLATLTVPGQSSVTVPLGPLNGDPQLRNSIAVQSNAAKGALYASMVVFGGTKTPSVQLLARDSMQPYNAGAHPWTTAEGAASTLVMFNYSSAPQTFFVAIASGGVLWQRKYQLAALETKTLDIGNLIATGVKDENGLVLPAAATSGVAQWFTPNFGQGTGRLLVSQQGIGLARNFGCLNMVVLGGTSSMPNNNVMIAAGSSGQMGPYQMDLYMGQVGFCGGTFDMTTEWPTNWTSSNPSVASIPTPSGPPAPTINGNTAGSAGITAAGITEEYNYQPLDLQWWCTAPSQEGTVTVYDPGPSNVSISPTSFTVGTATPFTITGSNLGTNLPTMSFPFAATYSLSNWSDSQVTGSLTANVAGSGNWTFTSGGFGGQAFASDGPGDLPTTTPGTPVSATGGTQISVSGKSFIFVGSDPQELWANSYSAANSQPSGGTLSATSSDSNDRVTQVAGPPPVVQFTTPDQSASSSDRTLTFTYTAGGQSPSQTMQVTARQLAYVTNPAPSNTCTLGYGTQQTYIYTVYTHPDKQPVDGTMSLGGTGVTESFAPHNPPGCGSHTGDGSLNQNGQFTDNVTYCSSRPITCSETDTQSLAVAGFPVRTNTLVYSSSGIAYTNNGPNQ